jgi:hypothetical protein
MFDMAHKIATCKIYTSYTSSTSTSKLKPTGVLSFIRKDPISDDVVNSLKQELSTIGIKIYSYKSDKGLKCAVMLSDFYRGDLNDSEDAIEIKAK